PNTAGTPNQGRRLEHAQVCNRRAGRAAGRGRGDGRRADVERHRRGGGHVLLRDHGSQGYRAQAVRGRLREEGYPGWPRGEGNGQAVRAAPEQGQDGAARRGDQQDGGDRHRHRSCTDQGRLELPHRRVGQVARCSRRSSRERSTSRTSTRWWCTSRSLSSRLLRSSTSSLGSPVLRRWRGRLAGSSCSELSRPRSPPAVASTPRKGSWWTSPSARRSSRCTSGGCCASSERASCSPCGHSWPDRFLAAAGPPSCSCCWYSSQRWSGAPTSAVAWSTTTTRAATPAANPSSSASSGGRHGSKASRTEPRLEHRGEMSDTSAMRFE